MLRFTFGMLAVAIATVVPAGAVAEVALGFANPLSGPYARSGARNRSAVELAVADLNAAGGVLGQEVRLLSVDDACGLQEALDAARALVAAGVRAVIGHMCSHASLLAAGIYETADILMITPGSTHPRLTEEGRTNVLRLIGRDDRQGELAGDFLAERFAGARIAIVHDGSTYGEGLAREARKRLHALGVSEVVYDLYTPGEGDYTALVARLEEAAVDVLYIGGYGPDAGLIVRTARERGDGLQLIGGDGLGMDEFWSIAGRAGDGTIFSSRPDVSARPAAAAVLARLGRQGRPARSGGLGAYAAVQVWAGAVERAGTFELTSVARTLRRGHFPTVLGRVAFDAKGDLEGAAWQWKRWANGTDVPLESDVPVPTQ